MRNNEEYSAKIRNAQRKKMNAMELRKNLREKVKKTLPKKLRQLRSGRKNSRRVAPRRIRNRAQAHESRVYSEYALVSLALCDHARSAGARTRSGTGTSFPAYPRHCEVTGIDLAADMLGRARAKIAKNTWFHLHVMEMDALNLTFEDNSFDYVTAFHTVTVVPDPIRMLAEANRVCRPGGKIVIINHFTTDLPIIGPLTEALDPVSSAG